jgi:hypothetical protein
MANGETFDLGELAKKPYPKATGGLAPDKADEVRRDQIVAIEFLFDRAILLGQVDRRANGCHQHEIVGIARDAN